MTEGKEPRKRANDGRVRAVIDALSPMVDGGRFAAKRIDHVLVGKK